MKYTSANSLCALDTICNKHNKQLIETSIGLSSQICIQIITHTVKVNIVS